jgi:hypothetical protein
VTVVGEMPAVDTHTAKREMTLSNDALRSIPTVRTTRCSRSCQA